MIEELKAAVILLQETVLWTLWLLDTSCQGKYTETKYPVERVAFGVTLRVIVVLESPTLLFVESCTIEAAFKVSGTTPVNLMLVADAFKVPAELNT